MARRQWTAAPALLHSVMAQITLYAWAFPAFVTGSPVDHTWVTTYDNRVHAYPNEQQVATAGESYWFCWGAFHAAGGTPHNPAGALGQQASDLALSQCLVQCNADSRIVPGARGTIFTYGVDGVCHQLANQVLYATAGQAAQPLTVRNARGYMASVFVYGTYGLQHAAWWAQVHSCGARPLHIPGGPAMVAAGAGATPPPDDFEARAREVLAPEDPKLLNDLLALRADVHRFSAQRWPGFTEPSAEALNARNQHMLEQAALLLGPEKFERIFGFAPSQRVDLVDPSMKTPPR